MGKKNNFSQDDKKIIKDFNKTLDYVSRNIKNFNFDKALKRFYQFFWRRFCDYYLETCKGDTKNNPEVLKLVLENSLKILHPFMPFLTEYLWGIIKKEDLLFLQKWPQRI
jgi:valyl-tRNA synthetase